MPKNLGKTIRKARLASEQKTRTLSASPDPGVWRSILRFQILVFSVPDYPNNHFSLSRPTLQRVFTQEMKKQIPRIENSPTPKNPGKIVNCYNTIN
jgi:hypothetical protein